MIEPDELTTDPTTPVLIECFYCGKSRVYAGYEQYRRETARREAEGDCEWVMGKRIACIPCAIELLPDIVW